ncbi:hypothetical protein ACFL9U_03275 [Thermodesulfobacteriota bacterium]
MPKKPSFGKRQVYVKKKYQAKFILKFCLLILAGSVLSTGLLFVFSLSTVTSSFDGSRLVVRSTASAILPAILLTNLITLIIILIATIFVVLYISHKIAGPMLRFEKELTLIGKGDLTARVNLREGDQFEDVGKKLGILAANLRSKLRAIRKETEEIIASTSQQDAKERTMEDIERLNRLINKHFKL